MPTFRLRQCVQIVPAVVFLYVCIHVPPVHAASSISDDSETRYNYWLSGQNSTYRKNIKKLDDAIVRELPIPVLIAVSRSTITPNFGDPRGGGTRTHEGLDILAPEGTPIVSPAEAVVVRTGDGPSSGNYVITRNPGGEAFVYMHLDRVANLKVGQILNVGDLIGTVGHTGNANGTNHLHLEIRTDRAYDPYPRLVKEFTFDDTIQYLNKAVQDKKIGTRIASIVSEKFTETLTRAQTKKYTLNSILLRALEHAGEKVSLADAETELSRGDEDKSVVAVQTALIVLASGPYAQRLSKSGATGYFGPVTEAAMREFQRAHKLNDSGVFTESTKRALLREQTKRAQSVTPKNTSGTPTLSSLETIRAQLLTMLRSVPMVVTGDLAAGAQGSEVKLLQAYLIAFGKGDATTRLSRDGVSGHFGDTTGAAVREYQETNGLAQTGVYDSATRAFMSAGATREPPL